MNNACLVGWLLKLPHPENHCNDKECLNFKENITAFIFIFSPYFECKTDFFKNEDGEPSGHNLRACQNSLCYTWPNVLLTLRVLEGIINYA